VLDLALDIGDPPAGIALEPGAVKAFRCSSELHAARALLRWSAEDLARQSLLSVATIRRAELTENGTSMTLANDLAVRRALEPPEWSSSRRTVVAPGCALKSALGQNQTSDTDGREADASKCRLAPNAKENSYRRKFQGETSMMAANDFRLPRVEAACLSNRRPITKRVSIPGRPLSLQSGAISPSSHSQSTLPASCTSSCFILMI
jgi:hypothetical protein